METLVTSLSDYELERGKPMPSTVHAFIQGNLVYELKDRYRKEFTILPEINLNLPGGRPTVPDLAVYSRFEVDVRHDIIYRTDAPLITIEILSPRQNLQDLIEKTDQYFAAGVQSCWIVIPGLKAIAVYHQPGTYDFFTEASALKDRNLPIELPVSTVFG
ncbi:MAG: Uma2 family endonuclease [Ferruginibacter sp.]|nr:Uma2 family endonuclease [Cytophagales bacterium]